MEAQIRSIRFFIIVVTACSLSWPHLIWAQPTDDGISADEIMLKSYRVHGGDDSISTLTFNFMEPNNRERKLEYTMLWKDYKGRDGITTKMIFFKEFPPADKGIAYMTWMYQPDLNQDDDEWLYLPELRTVRKLSKKIGDDQDGHNKHDEDSEFSKSVLHRTQLVPRQPDLDNHQLLRVDEKDGEEFYVIDSTPKNKDDNYPYSRTINWVSKDHFLLTKIDYFNMDGEKTLHQEIKWQNIDKSWVWDKVEGTDLNTGNKTSLTVSNVRINTGIDDDAFTKRVMKLGIDSLRLVH